MTVRQISIFLQNSPGKLQELTNVLEKYSINMQALSLAETTDFGIIRLIVDDPYKASTVLKEEGYICSMTKVLAVEIPDNPGGLAGAIRALGDNGINIEYMYAFITKKKDVAYVIFRVEDNEKAIKALTSRKYRPMCQDELNQM